MLVIKWNYKHFYVTWQTVLNAPHPTPILPFKPHCLLTLVLLVTFSSHVSCFSLLATYWTWSLWLKVWWSWTQCACSALKRHPTPRDLEQKKRWETVWITCVTCVSLGWIVVSCSTRPNYCFSIHCNRYPWRYADACRAAIKMHHMQVKKELFSLRTF